MGQVLQRYKIGKDFTQEEFDKWLQQLTWWTSSRMTKIENPGDFAERVLKAALNGTKIDGSTWPNVSNDFFKRVKQMAGYDLKLGIGIREPTPRKKVHPTLSGEATNELPPIDTRKALEMRADYIKELEKKYPHLDNPVYQPKVEELAETIVKSRMISNDFLTARGKTLEGLSKVRESLHKQIGELMEFLEISPKQRVTKQLEAKNADVGSLISRLESYGELWEEYEKLDAVRELLQKYKMLKSARPDGTPQLNDWELWHMTRNRPVHFTCRCGETYELLGGFTPEEIEQALLQANEVYGFGLEPIVRPEDQKEVTPEDVELEFEDVSPPETTEDLEPNDESESI